MPVFATDSGTTRRPPYRALAALAACGLAVALLCTPELRGDHHSSLKKAPEGVKYARGKSARQTFAKPEGDLPEHAAAAAADAGVHLDDAHSFAAKTKTAKDVTLVPRYQVIRPVGKAGAAASYAAHYQFDLHYGKLPIAKASRALVLSGKTAVLVRDRNAPTDLTGVGTADDAKVTFEAARAAAIDQSTAAVKGMSKKKTVLAVDTSPTSPPRLAVWLDDKGVGQLAWEMSVRSLDPTVPFLRRFWVSAKDKAAVLDYEDRIFYARPPRAEARPARPTADPFRDAFVRALRPAEPAGRVRAAARLDDAAAAAGVHGTVTGTVWDVSPFRDVTDGHPLSNVDVVLTQPGKNPIKTTTDAQGRYSFPGVTGKARVSATLSGPFARVIDQSGHATLSRAKSGTGEINLDFKVAKGKEFQLAQVNGFCRVNEAWNFAAGFLPDTPKKLARVPVNVNIDDTCNAFWQPGDNTINFFRSGGGCPNTAYRTVAFHEYGHGIDDELGGIQDGGYSEGFGDSVSILITRSSVIGDDFGGTGNNLRDANQATPVLWPNVENAEVHDQGEAYGGFTWDLTQTLKAQLGNEAQAFAVAKALILGAATHDPVDIPSAVRWSFFVDAQMFPGAAGKSLHYDALKAAAERHKIPVPPPVAAAKAATLFVKE